MRRWRGAMVATVLLGAGAGGLGVLACNDSLGGPGEQGPNDVWIQSSAFNPTPLTVAPGTRVTWTNKDPQQHTVTASDAGAMWGSGQLGRDQTYERTFSTIGSYNYVCSNHPSMSGRVVVK